MTTIVKKIILRWELWIFVILCLTLALASCKPAATVLPTAVITDPPTALPATSTMAPTNTAAPTATEAPLPAGIHLDPLTIPKYVDALVIPPEMPPTKTGDVVEYEIAVRQFKQQVLPTGMPMTTVWGYGKLGDPLPGSGEATTFNYPAFTVETRTNQKVRVTWVNQLVDDPESATPKFLPHLFPVDQTIHWANPGNVDQIGNVDTTPYVGPVPIVTHVHGSHVDYKYDGHPSAWYLPAASDISAGYSTQGANYASAVEAPAGSAVYDYTNDQAPATIWYHDHALGMTRLNVYAGLAGFWLIRGGFEDALNLPGPAPKLGDPAGTKYYEIPLAIQDKSFNTDGALSYPTSRKDFDDYEGPYYPETDIAPIWNPEFFGDAMVVNGKTWPLLEVEPRLYRFRMVNGCSARFLLLQFDKAIKFYQIGTEQGFLPDSPVVLDQVLMAPAERADVIVDFSDFKPGDEITMLNFGPDSPFGNLPIAPEDVSNPETTGQVMKFKVVALTDQGNPGKIPTILPSIARLTSTLPERELTLNEIEDEVAMIPVEALLGTLKDGPLGFEAPITENPQLNDTEIWTIINLTADAHPIHMHLVAFQVLDRTPFDVEAFMEVYSEYLEEGEDLPNPRNFVTGPVEKPKAWEMGWKDTAIANQGYITRFIQKFDQEGLYVWHCHIIDHEDNEMMRPFYVGQIPK